MENNNEQLMRQFYREQSAREKQDKLQRFKRLNLYVKPGQILFAGSSLMEQFPIYEFLQDFDLPYTIYNRGVGGFTSAELLENIEDCIYALQPKHIFLNIGTNDLNGPDYDQQTLIARYTKILQGIRERLPQAKLHLLAYYPVNATVGSRNPHMKALLEHRTNARIAAANAAVQELAAQYSAQFLDLNAPLRDENGELKKEYTIEGMHMYANGYKPILDQLLPVLASLD